MNSRLFILSKCDYTWTKHHLVWRSSQCQKTLFVSSMWFLAESTTLKLNLSAVDKDCVSVFVPGDVASYKLSEGLSVVFHHCSAAEHIVQRRTSIHLTWNPTEHESPGSQPSFEWWLFQHLCQEEEKWETRMMRDRQRERAEGGRGRTEMLWVLRPRQCCMPLPLRFPRDMNEVNEWWTQPTNAPLLLRPSSPFTGMSEA